MLDCHPVHCPQWSCIHPMSRMWVCIHRHWVGWVCIHLMEPVWPCIHRHWFQWLLIQVTSPMWLCIHAMSPTWPCIHGIMWLNWGPRLLCAATLAEVGFGAVPRPAANATPTA